MILPILYSYRRCPYAMRARMALKLADIDVEIREISLRNKPAHLLQVSPKGTVPVLILTNGTVIEESLEIMFWALNNHALGANIHAGDEARMLELIADNDDGFKKALDGYKYPERYPNLRQQDYRAQGELFLQKLENLLIKHDYLISNTLSIADIAIFPFVRQFVAVDNIWFAGDHKVQPYPKLNIWLNQLVESNLFISVMEKQSAYLD